MGGLLVLFLAGLYVWGTTRIVRRIPPTWGKALVIIAAILIPTADAVYGRYKLKEMCATEGGLRFYRVVENVKGFDAPSFRPDDEWILKYGYQLVEGVELGGKHSRLSLGHDGKITREVGIVPVAEYIYEMDKGDSRDIFDRSGTHIRVRSTGEILSREININYAGGWVERFTNGIYAARGTAGTCGPVVSIHELITKTLKPINWGQTK